MMSAIPAEADDLRALLLSLYDVGAFILRDTPLKSGLISPFYVDLRLTVSHPQLLAQIARRLEAATASVHRTLLCGVPYTALPFATAMSLSSGVPMVMRRKERKRHGMGKLIEGVFKAGEECLVVEDLVTSGSSVLETVAELREASITVRNVVVLLDREQGARANLGAHGVHLHAVTTVSAMVNVLLEARRITDADANKIRNFTSAAQVAIPAAAPTPPPMNFQERAGIAKSPLARRLFSVMQAKRTNLCVAADVANKEALLMLADAVGPSIAVLKTHADIITDWDASTGVELRKLADRHQFLIFEDRKFADIGNTVAHQLEGGVHRIGTWADFVNAHAVPGPGIIAGLKQGRAGNNFGVVLLAEMSSKGNLASELEGYKSAVVAMAENDPEFVFGFISMGRLNMKNADRFVFMTPGVKLQAGGGTLGQQYNTPERAVIENGTDLIIVGRGVYRAQDPCAEAEKYRHAAWSAYLKRAALAQQ